MADGCLSNVVKYALFLTNFLIFVSILSCTTMTNDNYDNYDISPVAWSCRTMTNDHHDNYLQLLGVAVLGCGIWVLVDKPSFLDLFEQVGITKTKTNAKTKTNLDSLRRAIYF